MKKIKQNVGSWIPISAWRKKTGISSLFLRPRCTTYSKHGGKYTTISLETKLSARSDALVKPIFVNTEEIAQAAKYFLGGCFFEYHRKVS